MNEGNVQQFILYPNPNLKVLSFDCFKDLKLCHFQDIVENYPNIEKIAFKLDNEDQDDNFISKIDANIKIIDALKILLRGLKQLKLLAVTALDFHNIKLSLIDVINLLQDAENLEFFLIKAEIDDFDEIYRHFTPKFDVVRYFPGILLMSQKEILDNIKNVKENRSLINFFEGCKEQTKIVILGSYNAYLLYCKLKNDY